MLHRVSQSFELGAKSRFVADSNWISSKSCQYGAGATALTSTSLISRTCSPLIAPQRIETNRRANFTHNFQTESSTRITKKNWQICMLTTASDKHFTVLQFIFAHCRNGIEIVQLNGTENRIPSTIVAWVAKPHACI